MFKIKTEKKDVDIKFGPFQLFVKRNFNVIYTLNDILLGLYFLVGSIFFLFDSMQTPAIWLFIIGSLQMLIRPVIRLLGDIKLEEGNGKGSRK